jgi:peptide deformylase
MLHILEHPHPTLRAVAAPVTRFDGTLKLEVERLIETLHSSGGIGLSGPQVGLSKRIAVADLSTNATEPQVFINPELSDAYKIGWVQESCLSIPGVVGNVARATRITVKAQDIDGNSFERKLDDMYAVCLQHEHDHLEGILFIDRLSALKKMRMRLSRSGREVLATA